MYSIIYIYIYTRHAREFLKFNFVEGANARAAERIYYIYNLSVRIRMFVAEKFFLPYIIYINTYIYYIYINTEGVAYRRPN